MQFMRNIVEFTYYANSKHMVFEYVVYCWLFRVIRAKITRKLFMFTVFIVI